jgi:hypothetical protein
VEEVAPCAVEAEEGRSDLQLVADVSSWCAS